MDFTIHQLRCFLAVARELHFGRAAARLHLSPSALSEQVAALERRVSRPLFDRSPRGVELTDHGRELLPLARRAVESMDEAVEWGRGEAAEPSVRIGLMVASTEFRAIMADAARQIPGVRWQVRHLGFTGCHEALARAEVDCAFVVGTEEGPLPGFESLPLWEEDCLLVLSARHRLAGRDSLTLAEIAEETFVAVEGGTHARWFASVAAEGSAPHLLPVARNFEEILEMCAAGQGVNIAGRSAETTYTHPGIRFVPIVDAPRVTTYLSVRQGRRPVALERFVRLCALDGPEAQT
ncbi:LysR family transcriptional regulator [Nocardiopsis aegyptia]|uniref:DNA-binding transcriptional LysR family regulator n=1 Tax=Nocardiopsis aegyptia TaxID=220378 RepID=A0A7Z0EIF8_9ACTN|nr:LysR substrate-binding domain-containing protein [Nocardiopsis aegyptia]NYJ32547.1 DNA-binding transcriptional LysR family regulator [Nocardiopsis aegyptia]